MSVYVALFAETSALILKNSVQVLRLQNRCGMCRSLCNNIHTTIITNNNP